MGVLHVVTTFAKYILFVFNLLIVLCAIALIAIGSIILAKEDRGIQSFTEFSVGGFAIAIGLIIFGIASFGCYGAIKQNRCLLATYAGTLILLFILQIVLGALALVIVNDDKTFDQKIRDIVRNTFKGYLNGDSDSSNIVNNIQQKFECCGVDGTNYWLNDMSLPKVPDSCCVNFKCNPSSIYKRGCAEAFKKSILANIVVIGGVAIGFGIVELLGAGFALLIRSQMDPFLF